jgi:hypothetical protein
LQNPIAGNNKILFGSLIAAAFVATIIISPMLVSALSDLLKLDRALVLKTPRGLYAALIAHGIIPKDGTGGAFGYGLLTAKGGSVQTDAVIVTTTHAGVLDSSVQKNKNDPVWHNHFVSLITPPAGSLCAKAGAPFQVDKITFNQPGRVTVDGQLAFMQNIPREFFSPDALHPDGPITLRPGNDVQQAVAFDLVPLPSAQNLKAVCVDNVTPADRINVLP